MPGPLFFQLAPKDISPPFVTPTNLGAMRILEFRNWFLTITTAATLQVSAAAPASLFDSQTLRGWEGDTNVWRVQDGAIVGGSLKGNPQNEFLATQRSYTNFILSLEYRLIGTEGFTNGGVQVRSRRITNPPNEMMGYQADIESGWSGSLYDESRRKKMLATADKALVQRIEKHGQWNRYEIRCDGRRIQLFLNGERTIDYTEMDSSIEQYGLIALQIHGNNKAEVAYRNVTIQELP